MPGLKIQIEIDERTLRQLVLNYLSNKLGDVPLNVDDVKIETKSTQNYKSEWEQAAFRARVDKTI